VEILLVRHALPVRVEEGEGGEGLADPTLAPLGLQQVEALTAWLGDERVDAIYSSPMRRARETAAPLATRLGLDIEIDDDLVEYDQGTFYVPIEELKSSGDPRWQAFLDGEFTDGIDIPGFRKRVVTALERIVAANPRRRVVVVCHGGVVNAYVTHILGIAAPFPFQVAYTSISRVLAASTGQRNVSSVNESGHVRGLLPE
jgi:probable phosphoglycerate mutase